MHRDKVLSHKHNTGTHERREEKNPHSVLSTVRDTTMKKKYARSIHTLEECTKSKNSITVWKLGVMSVEWARFHARTQTKRLDDKTCITWMLACQETQELVISPNSLRPLITWFEGILNSLLDARFVRDLCRINWQGAYSESWKYIFTVNKIMIKMCKMNLDFESTIIISKGLCIHYRGYAYEFSPLKSSIRRWGKNFKNFNLLFVFKKKKRNNFEVFGDRAKV